MAISISCINEVMNAKMSINPVAGMMGTMFVGSDRYMVVCTKVLSPTKVVVAVHGDYKIKTVDGIDYYDGNVEALHEKTIALPSWAIDYKNWEEDEFEDFKKRDFDTHVYSRRRNGRWMPKGHGCWGTSSIHWGKAESYEDPCF